jgi:hypothetical protein
MAIHTELPIYKLTYELMLLTMELTKHMPRELKATLGRKLHEECFNLTILVYRANCATAKTPHLDMLLERVQVAELLFRLAHDLRAISTGQYSRGVRAHGQDRQARQWLAQAFRIVACSATVKAVTTVRFLIWSCRWLTRPPPCAPKEPAGGVRPGLAQFPR